MAWPCFISLFESVVQPPLITYYIDRAERVEHLLYICWVTRESFIYSKDMPSLVVYRKALSVLRADVRIGVTMYGANIGSSVLQIL